MNKTEINKISMKAFEEKLYELNNNKVTYKSEFTQVGMEEDPVRLWLYYDDNDTHIGTYNKISKSACYFPWIGLDKWSQDSWPTKR